MAGPAVVPERAPATPPGAGVAVEAAPVPVLERVAFGDPGVVAAVPGWLPLGEAGEVEVLVECASVPTAADVAG